MILFDNSYARLPERFFANQQPTPVSAPSLVRLNEPLARDLGLDRAWLRSPEGVAMLAGNTLPDSAEPLAQAYAGHQFGGFVPQLGDGRAILLGELKDREGKRRDLQLKGSGRTPFSRGGDGRATLGSVVREYLVSEAMFGLKIPTTRALAAISTGERVPRQEFHPGGVFTRVASSHIRVGTFQYFFAQSDLDGIKTLADFVIERHYPDAANAANPCLALLESVASSQAALIAKWLQVGFIHGVMNTDNMTVSGETIDFGPCAFMDIFHPEKVFSSIDSHGRYAWGNQPNIGYWNLERLGETLAPFIAEDIATAKEQIDTVLENYLADFKKAHFEGFSAKLGIPQDKADDGQFTTLTLQLLARREIDFTLFFRHLTRVAEGETKSDLLAGVGKTSVEDLDDWLITWEKITGGASKERSERMRAHNPIIIPRNHRVEEAIAAAEKGEFEPFKRFTEALTDPFSEDSALDPYEVAPSPEEVVCATFCGT
ncbi:YdiU family protein [Verrucomicrobiales bacterium]|nr:YdiU family protein [Verrucomicrobiales bacterium]